MDTLSLPVVKTGTSLRNVMRRMRATGRSGAVYLEGNEYRLVKAPDVVIHMTRDPEAALTSLPHEPIRKVDVSRVARSTPGPTMHVHRLARELNRLRTKFGLLASSEELVVVSTASKTSYRVLASGPAECYCSKGHPVPGGVDGQRCSDGGRVWCDKRREYRQAIRKLKRK